MSTTATNPAPAYVRSASESRNLSLMGVSISVLAGIVDSKDVTISEYTAEAGAPGPVLHWHKLSTEWFYILDGEFTFEIAGTQRAASAGDFVLVPPRTLHRFWNSASARSRMIFGFNRAGMEGYFEELFEMVKNEKQWPPADLTKLHALAERYDTFSPNQL